MGALFVILVFANYLDPLRYLIFPLRVSTGIPLMSRFYDCIRPLFESTHHSVWQVVLLLPPVQSSAALKKDLSGLSLFHCLSVFFVTTDDSESGLLPLMVMTRLR